MDGSYRLMVRFWCYLTAIRESAELFHVVHDTQAFLLNLRVSYSIRREHSRCMRSQPLSIAVLLEKHRPETTGGGICSRLCLLRRVTDCEDWCIR